MPLDIPLPTASPYDDPSQYTPLLLSACEGFLLARDVWAEDDYDSARQYIEDLMSYIVELMAQGLIVNNLHDVFPPDLLLAEAYNHVGTLTRTIASGQLFNGGIEVLPVAQNNAITIPFFARAGTYRLTMLGIKGSNYGIVTAWVDGTSVTDTVDWYSAASVANAVGVYDIQVDTDGLNTLLLAALTKNASSTSYRFIVSQLSMRRTGDLP